jgi:diguanylate cyclase (GGDEF)-like protein
MPNLLSKLFKPYMFLVVSTTIVIFIYTIFYMPFTWTWLSILFFLLYIFITTSAVQVSESCLFSMDLGCALLILFFFGVQPVIIAGVIYSIISAVIHKKRKLITKVFNIKTYFNICVEILVTYITYIFIRYFQVDLHTFNGVMIVIAAGIIHISSNIILLFLVDSFYNGVWKTNHFALDQIKIELYSIVLSLIIVYTYNSEAVLLTLAIFSLNIPFHRLAQMNYLLKQQNQELITDTLTKAYNFKYFEGVLKNNIENKRNLALVFIDIDEFKEVNDKYGHSAGNKAIIDLTTMIRGIIGDKSILCRFGGDEFCIIVDESELDKIDIIAEDLIAKTSNLEIEYGKNRFNIRLSVGIYTANDSGEDIQAIIDKADNAMYEAKKQGGHKVVKCNTYAV